MGRETRQGRPHRERAGPSDKGREGERGEREREREREREKERERERERIGGWHGWEPAIAGLRKAPTQMQKLAEKGLGAGMAGSQR